MALQFNPQPYLELWQQQQAQRQQQRPDLNAMVNQPILQGLQGLADNRRQQQLDALARQKTSFEMANDQRKSDAEYGKQIDPNAMTIVPGLQTGQLQSPAGPMLAHLPDGAPGPMPLHPSAATPPPQAVGTAMPFVQALQRFMSGGMKPSDLTPDIFQSLGKDNQKTFIERTIPKPSTETAFTPEQYAAISSGDPARIAKAWQGLPIPKDVATLGSSFSNRESLNADRDAARSDRNDQFHDRQFTILGQRANPTVAPRGSLLGMAGQANARADRALTVANNPDMTFQDLNAVVTDLSGIFQGGAPHEQSLRDQNYGTLLNKIAQIQTYVTGQPATGMVPDAIRQKMISVVSDLKKVDNKIISDNIKAQEHQFSKTIHSSPEREKDWENMKQDFMGMTAGMNPQPAPGAQQPASGGAPDHNAAIQWAKSNPNDPRARIIMQRAQAALGGNQNGF